ncbi:hypothetical protein [Zavarzinella formosa]|uniref:hypothetical protein n=1 Tax=Zavarzinella formosa TaxID=360055 RepID=UPI0012F95823|nr:hypothetical protein [Zavarzinella formosa]
MENTRKCVDCGFLTQRTHYNGDQPKFVEVELNVRKTWNIPTMPVSGSNLPVPIFQWSPRCFCNSWDLGADVGECLPENALAVINANRTCDQFIKWRAGFTPKEHAEKRIADGNRLKEYVVRAGLTFLGWILGVFSGLAFR